MQQTDEGRGMTERHYGRRPYIWNSFCLHVSNYFAVVGASCVCQIMQAVCLEGGEISRAYSFKPVLPPCSHDGSRLVFNVCMN